MRKVAALAAMLLLMSATAEGQSPCVAPSPAATFGDGMWIVGTDIQPGTYRSTPADGACIWRRLSGFSGEPGDTIALGSSVGAPQVVTISDTDAGFDSSGCGAWSLVA